MSAYFVKLYLASLAAFLAIDLTWLGVVARKFYARHLGFLLAPNTLWAAAIAFYLLFVAGLVGFVIAPGVEKGSLGRVVLAGAFFGLVTYATYDLTNLATVKGWPVLLTFVDLAWGTFLATSVSAIGFLVGRLLR
jgi:uncharacterized membrane protein